ncbi:hypothetical protein QFZ22_005571 [Streptomyces canus]|uniref:Uncharacterized protein n=1 Tax=Streptomyces canus TaxID=58343 RepID=A0AAW8FHF4_9ACTN|nr:hypothetical protein [Streptomyces canus]MDQ0909586.1 hypothetical protein [Streptomyces canus]
MSATKPTSGTSEHVGREAELAVRLRVLPESGGEPETVERLTRALRRELGELHEVRVSPTPSGPPPPGAKGDAVTIGAIVVALSASGGVLTALVDTLRDWLGRRSARDRIVIGIGDDTLELEHATDAERAALVQAFVRRHSGSYPS